MTNRHDNFSDPANSAPQQISLPLSPIQVAKALQNLPEMIFFDSSGNLPQSSGPAISIIAAKPISVIQGNIHSDDDLQQLRNAIKPWQKNSAATRHIYNFPTGGACGTVDYEGSFSFGIYPEMLIYLHKDNEWLQCGNLSEEITKNQNTTQCPAPTNKLVIGAFKASMTQAEYEAKVRKIHEYIAAGDIYQVNLTQSFEADTSSGLLFKLYEHLRDLTPAPQSTWMNFCGREVLSSSPETFLHISNKKIETRPIKGTRPRFSDPLQDEASAEKLLSSEKEIAELVMITDLERNDLGKICEFGSVRVTDMLRLEKLAQVHHLVSTVTGTLRPEIDHISALQACFPGGSITGAPKKRAMEIIKELEPSSRGLYTGAIGYFGFNQESQFNIPIRTIIRENQRIHYHVGAGIVTDSSPSAEYQETLDKAKGIRLAIQSLAEQR